MQYAFYQDKLIMLYGNLTISEFEEKTGIAEFKTLIQLRSQNGSLFGDTYYRTFDDMQKTSKTYGVIGYSKDISKTLLAEIEPAESGEIEPYQEFIAVEEYLKTLNQRITMVSTNQFKKYFNSSTSSLDLRYEMYKNNNEVDPYFDYFGIVTMLFGEIIYDYPGTTTKIWELELSHSPTKAQDFIFESAPQSSSGSSTISYGVNIGATGITASIGATVNMPSAPKITRTFNSITEESKWLIQTRTLISPDLTNETFKASTSWRSTSTIASIKLGYRGSTRYIYDGVNDIFSDSGWSYETITFSY